MCGIFFNALIDTGTPVSIFAKREIGPEENHSHEVQQLVGEFSYFFKKTDRVKNYDISAESMRMFFLQIFNTNSVFFTKQIAEPLHNSMDPPNVWCH